MIGIDIAAALKQQNERNKSPIYEQGRQTHMMGVNLVPKARFANQKNEYVQEKIEVMKTAKLCPDDINFIKMQAAKCKL